MNKPAAFLLYLGINAFFYGIALGFKGSAHFAFEYILMCIVYGLIWMLYRDQLRNA